VCRVRVWYTICYYIINVAQILHFPIGELSECVVSDGAAVQVATKIDGNDNAQRCTMHDAGMCVRVCVCVCGVRVCGVWYYCVCGVGYIMCVVYDTMCVL